MTLLWIASHVEIYGDREAHKITKNAQSSLRTVISVTPKDTSVVKRTVGTTIEAAMEQHLHSKLQTVETFLMNGEHSKKEDSKLLSVDYV